MDVQFDCLVALSSAVWASASFLLCLLSINVLLSPLSSPERMIPTHTRLSPSSPPHFTVFFLLWKKSVYSFWRGGYIFLFIMSSSNLTWSGINPLAPMFSVVVVPRALAHPWSHLSSYCCGKWAFSLLHRRWKQKPELPWLVWHHSENRAEAGLGPRMLFHFAPVNLTGFSFSLLIILCLFYNLICPSSVTNGDWEGIYQQFF